MATIKQRLVNLERPSTSTLAVPPDGLSNENLYLWMINQPMRKAAKTHGSGRDVPRLDAAAAYSRMMGFDEGLKHGND